MILPDGLLSFLLGLLILTLQLVIVIREFAELRIVDALRSMKGQWKDFEGILTKGLVVLAHVNEEALFVC